MNKSRIVVFGMGYVGLSIATLLSQHNHVVGVDISAERVDMINNRVSPIEDDYIEEYFANKQLDLVAVVDGKNALADVEYAIMAVPTNYDSESNRFDTSILDSVIEMVLGVNPLAVIVIKSTIPVGYTQSIRQKYNSNKIIFSPEFLRESRALYDNLYASRIVVGTDSNDSDLMQASYKFAQLLQQGAIKSEVETLFMGFNEAEAVKLFSNAYLALRVAFFNELDTYSEVRNFNTKDIINGVCLDPRIGDYYNNPSFGYGGYCLPKDTQQLVANYGYIPQNIIGAIVNSNKTRKDHITARIIQLLKNNCTEGRPTIGIYRLIMKANSDNFRQSSVQDVIKRLQKEGVNIIIYEPSITHTDKFEGIAVVNDLVQFKSSSHCIIANRYQDDLDDVRAKVYTRDIFGNN